MSTLNSASSPDEVKAAYADNASYAEDSDAGKARGFITACRLLLLLLPKRAASGSGRSQEVEFDPQVLIEQIRDAKRWLGATADSTSQVTFSDFRNFRS